MNESVVLLHGLGRTKLSLALPERRLRDAGFRTINIQYPSRRYGIPHLARYVATRLPASGARPVHFLTHSMGGIVARCLLSQGAVAHPGRVVMLSPPNRGSQLVDLLKTNPFFRLATGPAGQQLGTDAESMPIRLGPVDFELGVIVGNRTWSPLAHLIRGESDGKVALADARVEGMVDFLVVPRGHTFIMNDSRVLDEVVHFFRHGRFASGERCAATRAAT